MATRELKDALSRATTADYGVAKLAADGGTTAGTVVQATDARLADARTPTAHKASHATGGTDALAPADIGAAAASHTHTSADVSDFAEAVRDRVGATLVAGANVTITVDDPGDTITIAASGGGGGSSLTVQDEDGSPSDGAVTTLIFPKNQVNIAAHVATIKNGQKYIVAPPGWDDAWRAARAAAGSAPASVAIVGDSFLQGAGSSNYQTKGAQNLIADALKAAYGDGGDFFGPWESQSFLTSVSGGTYAGTPPFVAGSIASTYYQQGLGRTAYNNTGGTGTVWTFTTPYACTDLDILVYRYNTTAGTWKYSVDGGADTTVTMSGYTQGQIARIAITGLANTAHTLVLKDPSAQNVLGVVGVVCRKASTGVHVARAAWYGMRIAHLFDNALLVAPNSEADAGKRAGSLYWRGAAGPDTNFPVNPHLAIIGLGLNDAVNALSRSSYYGSLVRLSRALRRGRADCSLLYVVHNYPDAENSDGQDVSSNSGNYPDIAAGIYEAADLMNAGVVNLTARWGETPVADGWQTSSGNWHPTDAGHQDIADLVLAAAA